jgi:hypothetical protein
MTMSRVFLLTLLFTVLLTFEGLVDARVLTVREVGHVRIREGIIDPRLPARIVGVIPSKPVVSHTVVCFGLPISVKKL